MKHILIIGATSAIAEATARRFASAGHSLYLAARDRQKLETMAADLRIRGARQVEYQVCDVTLSSDRESLIESFVSRVQPLDIALIAHGTLPDQRACEASPEHTSQELATNAVSTIMLLTSLANRFQKQRFGSIAVISSVAGDRGRQSNYVYGSAKAAVTTFMSGLRNRLEKNHVHVLTIKPGFVDTPMTSQFRKGILWVDADYIARGIVRALNKRSDVVYLPWFWRYIMIVIRVIPERIFKKLSL